MGRRKAALVCCSNALRPEMEPKIMELSAVLTGLGIETVRSGCMFSKVPWGHGSGSERAGELMKFYLDPTVTEIYDVSGGDLSNENLPYLDFDLIRENPKPFFGYSDLTVILNAVFSKTGREGVLYQVRNLISDAREAQMTRFGTDAMFDIPVRFLQGKEMSGAIIGGNIRCFLKLAGTEFLPDLSGKILLLEAYGGDVPQMKTYLSQLKLLGAFEKVQGVLLGTFTNMERNGSKPSMEELVLDVTPSNLTVAKTEMVGHGADSRAVRIGGFYRFSDGISL